MFIGVSSLGAVEPVCDYKEKRNNPEIIALNGQSAARVDGVSSVAGVECNETHDKSSPLPAKI